MILRKNLNLSDTVAIPPTDVPAGLTQQQLEDMGLLFADIVETNGPLTMDITRNRMSESMSLIEFVYDYKMVKRVYDIVVYLKRKDLPAKLAQTESEPSEEKTRRWLSGENASSLSSRSKTKWNLLDEEVLEKAFQKCEKCPRKSQIEETLAGHPQLAEIVERNTFSRCYEKVKNILKKRNK